MFALKAFIHEIGHLFGARHDRMNDVQSSEDTFQHGFFSNLTREDESDSTQFRDNIFMMCLQLVAEV